MSVPPLTPRTTARAPHDVIEPCHAVLYYAPQVRESFLVVGLKATWRGCFGGRAAALDPAPAAVVTTLFPLPHFKPSPVARAVPCVWEAALPDAVLAARSAGVDVAPRALLGDTVDGPELAEAAPLAATAAAACDAPGCALGAGMALALTDLFASAPWKALGARSAHRPLTG